MFDFEDELRDLSSADVDRATRAFERLIEASRPLLLAYVNRRIRPPLIAEDIVQDVIVRLWTNRARFKPLGWLSWMQYLKRSADWSIMSALREGIEVPFEAIEDLPIADIETLEGFVYAKLDRDAIRRCADLVLLGIDASIDPRVLNRRVLAAKMYFIDGESWSDVAELLSSARRFDKPVTRDDLDEWFSDRSVLISLFYATLYMSPEELCRHLMESDWTEEERALISLRYCNALLIAQILNLEACKLSERDLLTLCDRCVAKFPFAQRMRSLLTKVGKQTGKLGLEKPHLWQRLAFEYCYFDSLSHLDIVDRTDPAAKEIGAQVNGNQLNVWLSNGRLIDRVAKCLKTKVSP